LREEFEASEFERVLQLDDDEASVSLSEPKTSTKEVVRESLRGESEPKISTKEVVLESLRGEKETGEAGGVMNLLVGSLMLLSGPKTSILEDAPIHHRRPRNNS